MDLLYACLLTVVIAYVDNEVSILRIYLPRSEASANPNRNHVSNLFYMSIRDREGL